MKKIIIKSDNPKFVLRHITMEDASEWLGMHKDGEAKRNFMSVPESLSKARKDIEEILNKAKKKMAETFAIDVGGEFAGFVGVHSLDKKLLNRKGAVGVISFGLRKKSRGQGITTEAVKLFIDYIFKKYKLEKISGRCRAFNKASVKLMEKCGFVFESRHKGEAFKDGKYYDNLYYGRGK